MRLSADCGEYLPSLPYRADRVSQPALAAESYQRSKVHESVLEVRQVY